MNSTLVSDNDSKTAKPRFPTDFVNHFLNHPNFIKSHFQPAGFIIDLINNKILYLEETSEQILGMPVSFFISKSNDVYLNLLHPEDAKIIEMHVIGKSLEYLHLINNNDYENYFISYNYRIKTVDEEYKHIFQRFNYISEEVSGEMCGIAGYIMDITHFKFDNIITHTIEKYPSEKTTDHEVIYKRTFCVAEEGKKHLLSFREIEILKHIGKGLPSKQIAFLMNISVNTVNNHRKNMLHKTNCKSSSELISFAEKLGLLTQ